jgi:hypothetical protein
MIDGLMESSRCYGMEMNVDKTKVTRISTIPTVQFMMEQKHLENVAHFKYLSSIIKYMQEINVKLNLGLPW